MSVSVSGPVFEWVVLLCCLGGSVVFQCLGDLLPECAKRFLHRYAPLRVGSVAKVFRLGQQGFVVVANLIKDRPLATQKRDKAHVLGKADFEIVKAHVVPLTGDGGIVRYKCMSNGVFYRKTERKTAVLFSDKLLKLWDTTEAAT
ncbi:MAG: hypothetical protein QNJ03_11970 [Dinoroseobacter sp.]|nr:hypothetical protein [Dinoroseobacter sp.]